MTLETIFWLWTGFAFVFGAVVGSFLNVVIYRVPAGLSVVHPPSRCPECGASIRWYDNIPVVSWALLLRGRCRQCKTPIAARYALVELLTGLLTAGLWAKVAWTPVAQAQALEAIDWVAVGLPFGLYFVFVCLLVVITFVDLDHMIIPHRFTLTGMVFGLATPVLINLLVAPGALAHLWPRVTIFESAIGFVAGALAVVVIFYAYFIVRGQEGIGGGDMTLMAMLGAWLGWPALMFIFFAASLQGVLVAALAYVGGSRLVRRWGDVFADEQAEAASEPGGGGEDIAIEAAADGAAGPDEDRLAVPFGPFLALAALEFFYFGQFLPPMFSMSYLYEF